MSKLLFDLSHTSHTRARTGIQRVARALRRELGAGALAVTFDPYLGHWRALEPWEQANLDSAETGAARGAQWPFAARWRGRWQHLTGRTSKFAMPDDCAGFLTAEIFSSRAVAHLPATFPRVAVFHDAIALRYPELSPSGTIARFPGYMRELLQFDGIAAVSEESRDALVDYWRWLGVAQPPPVQAIALGVDLPTISEPASAPVLTGMPVVLSVGTLEGRKNHVALLDACEQLWAGGGKFELRMVGAVQRQTGRAALEKLRALQAAGRPLRYDGPMSEAGVDAAYAHCSFTVYPSLAEGFGLPVIESLARGRPCICSAHGALGELSRAGGCVPLESVDSASLAAAISRLLSSPDDLAVLSAAARARTHRTWRAYAQELTDWMKTLPRRG